jgi:tRNA(Ile)-lysidine synthase
LGRSNQADKQAMLTKHITDFLQSKKLVIATSGGVDSMVLVDLLLKNQNINKDNLIIAHFDHKIRSESKNDADFVKTYCQKNKLKIELGNADNKANLEATARKYRYQFLEELRQKSDSDLILTAHHQDDNLETVIMNWQRGAGLFGLSGILALNQKTKIYRPLLYLKKSDLIDHAEKQKIQHIIDESNYDLNFRRNQIRHQIMPELESWKLDYKETILELIELAKTCQIDIINTFLEISIRLEDNQLKLNKRELSNLPGHKLNNLLIFIIRNFQSQTNKQQLLLLKKNIKNLAGNKLCLIGKLAFLTKGKSILLNTKL